MDLKRVRRVRFQDVILIQKMKGLHPRGKLTVLHQSSKMIQRLHIVTGSP